MSTKLDGDPQSKSDLHVVVLFENKVQESVLGWADFEKAASLETVPRDFTPDTRGDFRPLHAADRPS